MKRLTTHILTACLLLASPVAHAGSRAPEAFADLPPGHYQPFDAGQLLKQWQTGTRLQLAGRQRVNTRQLHSHRHANGDISLGGADPASGLDLHITIGNQASFGELRGPDGHWLITTDRHGSWMVRLPEHGISYNQCGLEHGPADKVRAPGATAAASSAPQAQGDTHIDVLLIYNHALAMRYPGDILATRLNHLVYIANQSMANSALPVTLQMVGSARFDYANFKSNLDYRNDIAATLAGEVRAGLEGLRELRDQLGADLVIGLRPHDIEARGNCGIAFFPANDPNFGVNVVSDGMSSWSVCLDDTMTHEIGHNLGAAHQAGQGGGAPDPRGAALVRPGQYSTIMSSFGTGQPDRFRGLGLFSNPQLSCGGRPCGNSVNTDNAAVIRSFMTAVAAYRGKAVLPPPQTEPLPPALPDSDADGLPDWQDAFPFDATETSDADLDGRGDNSDAFPFAASEQADFDGDGIGDNADPDDDNDGVVDFLDAFPFDALESADSDADGSGNNTDAFPAVAAEQRDDDGDGMGNHADSDDDNDGIPELDPVLQDLLVVSAGNNRVQRFDAHSGAARGVEITGETGLLTFQSDLAFRASDNSLFYTAASAVQRLDLLTREPLGTWVPPFSNGPAAVQLASGFPTGLALLNDRLLVSRQGNATLGDFSGRGVARYSPPPALRLDAGSAPLDVSSNGQVAWALVRNQRSLFRIDAAGVQLLAGPGLAWMRNPRRLLATDDGRLLISDAGRNTVVAVDADTGEFLGDFIDFNALGYSGPDGLVQLHEGTLLVAAAADDAVLAFTPDSGDLIDVRVPPGSEGLSEPRAMVVVPALRDYYASDPRRSFRPNAGLWGNAATDGRGFDIQVFGERLSVIWYSYDDAGLPTWYLAAGRLQGQVFEQPLLRFDRDRNGAVSSTPVGSLRIEFSAARAARVSYAIDGVTATEPIAWLRLRTDPASPDHTGIWGPDDGSDAGLSIARQGQVSVAIAYLYDGDGAPRWLISRPVSGPNPSRFAMQASFSTGLCPACSGPRAFEYVPAGNMDISLPASSNGSSGLWSSSVSFPAPLAGEWLLAEAPVIRFSAVPERPR